jgi:hypothetical protein
MSFVSKGVTPGILAYRQNTHRGHCAICDWPEHITFKKKELKNRNYKIIISIVCTSRQRSLQAWKEGRLNETSTLHAWLVRITAEDFGTKAEDTTCFWQLKVKLSFVKIGQVVQSWKAVRQHNGLTSLPYRKGILKSAHRINTCMRWNIYFMMFCNIYISYSLNMMNKQFNYKEKLCINSRSNSGTIDWLARNRGVSNTSPLQYQ